MNHVRVTLFALVASSLSACAADDSADDAGIDAFGDAGTDVAEARRDSGPMGPLDLTIEVLRETVPASAGRHLLTDGNVFGGTVWFPLSGGDYIEPQISRDGHRMGALRYSLQYLNLRERDPAMNDAEVLTRMLGEFTDLDFLRAYQAAGGEVLLNIDAMPQYLADESGIANCEDPEWRNRPPLDYDVWKTEVVQPIVEFFAENLGTGMRYELWNEPNFCSWIGTTDEFLQLYVATAEAVVAVDPTARVGGPSNAGIFDVGTENEGPLPPGSKPFLQSLIEYAGAQGVPFDFVTIHTYLFDPTRRANAKAQSDVETVRGWLTNAGFAGDDVEIINDEWNNLVFGDPATDNLNTSYVNAPFIGSALIQMHTAGMNNHAAQAYVDTGAEVLSPFMTVEGVPRSAYNVFEMLNFARGTERETATSDGWAQSAAFDDGDETVVFVSMFAPNEELSRRTITAMLVSNDPELGDVVRENPLLRRAYFEYLADPDASSLPSTFAAQLTPAQQMLVVEARDIWQADAAKREAIGLGPEPDDALAGGFNDQHLSLVVHDVSSAPASVLHAVIDSQNVVGPDQTDALLAEMRAEALRLACESTARLIASQRPGLVCAGLDAFCATGDSSTLIATAPEPADPDLTACFGLGRYAFAFRAQFGIDERFQDRLSDSGLSPDLIMALLLEINRASGEFRAFYDALWSRPDVALQWTDISSMASVAGGTLTLDLPVEPFSMHAFRVIP